jgi:hypothetical protein
MRRLASITSLRHLSLIGNRLSVEHVTSLIAAAAGLRELRELHADAPIFAAAPLAAAALASATLAKL